jgi:O-antigen/teichoic acid export membrane protein
MLNAHFSNILNIANDKNLGVIAVGYLTTPYYAGLYRAARAIVKIIRRIMDPLLEIIFPELVKLYSEKKFTLYKKIIYDSTKLVLLVSLAMGGVIFYFSNSLIVIFFGEEYIEAVLALRILIGAMIIHNLAYWVNPTILSSGNAKFLTISTIITTVIYCISLSYFIQQASHEGAAIALLIKNLSTLLLGILFYFKFLKNKI